MIRRVRQGRKISFHYRCDAPDRRRVFNMQVRLLATGDVEFASWLVHEELRPSVPLLERGHVRSKEMLYVCSWCQKVAVSTGEWVPVETAVSILHLMEAEKLPFISHGMCPACRDVMMATLDAE